MCSKKTKLAIATLGCKTNFFESAGIIEGFEDCELVDFQDNADIYIINSCTVTNRTDYKSRNLIRKALAKKELNPDVKIVVTGCFAQRSQEEIAIMGEIDFIIDNQSKLDIAEILRGKEHEFCDIMEAKDFAFKPVRNMLDHTRAFQKIQDGCDFFCKYCAVPYARGHSRSAHYEDVISQAKIFVKQGFREIVLGGVNLGLYRDKDKNLAEVVSSMSEIEGLDLIRISSIEPQLLSGEMLKLLAESPKLCPHFHIPLQSGSDTILRSMGRRYDTALVSRLVDNILSRIPHAAIGFDVICGFPGETEELFEETRKYLESLAITYMHVFSYSPRKGTVAASLPDQLPNSVKSARTSILSAVSDQKKKNYKELLLRLNPILRGVIEKSDNVQSESLSDHFLRVRIDKPISIGSIFEERADNCDFLL